LKNIVKQGPVFVATEDGSMGRKKDM